MELSGSARLQLINKILSNYADFQRNGYFVGWKPLGF